MTISHMKNVPTKSGGSPHCRSCFNAEKQINKVEDITHIITICNSYTDIRERIIEEFSSLCKQSKSKVDF